LKTIFTKQRAIIKLYLINLIEQKQTYGLHYQDIINTKIKAFDHQPAESEIYKVLHELTSDGLVRRDKRLMASDGLKEVVVYSLTDSGYKEALMYKQLVKEDLERSRRIIDKVLKDNF
jgi:DNA-binding PadR family transcriptional regulator